MNLDYACLLSHRHGRVPIHLHAVNLEKRTRLTSSFALTLQGGASGMLVNKTEGEKGINRTNWEGKQYIFLLPFPPVQMGSTISITATLFSGLPWIFFQTGIL